MNIVNCRTACMNGEAVHVDATDDIGFEPTPGHPKEASSAYCVDKGPGTLQP